MQLGVQEAPEFYTTPSHAAHLTVRLVSLVCTSPTPDGGAHRSRLSRHSFKRPTRRSRRCLGCGCGGSADVNETTGRFGVAFDNFCLVLIGLGESGTH